MEAGEVARPPLDVVVSTEPVIVPGLAMLSCICVALNLVVDDLITVREAATLWRHWFVLGRASRSALRRPGQRAPRT